MGAWYELVRHEREHRNLTQEELAGLADVSTETVSLYERNRVRPTRATLLRISHALRLDRTTTNALLEDAGCELLPAVSRLIEIEAHRGTMAQFQREVAGYAWPCFVLNERGEMLCWNAAALRVLELDLGRDLPRAQDRNLVRLAALPHIRDRLLNWDEVVGVLIGLLRVDSPELDALGGLTPYYAAVLQDLVRDYPDVLNRLWALWQATPLRREDSRTAFPIVWRRGDGSRLRFNSVSVSWSDYDALWAWDWQPADGATWEALRGAASPDVGERPPVSRPAAEVEAPDADLPAWNELLRRAREATGLTQRRLAAAAGVAEATIKKYESGRGRRPERDALLWLAWAMDLDGAATNAILTGAGLEPEPSEWSLLVSGLARHSPRYRHYLPEMADRARARLGDAIAAHPWPCLIVDEDGRIIAWNSAMSRVVGGDLARRSGEGYQPDVLRFALDRPFRSRVANWGAVITALAPAAFRQAVLRGQGEGANARIAAIVDDLRAHKPDLLALLEARWRSAPQPSTAVRVTFPLIWNHDDGATLSFNAVVAPWTAFHSLWAFDWHPADRATWSWLDARAALRRAHP